MDVIDDGTLRSAEESKPFSHVCLEGCQIHRLFLKRLENAGLGAGIEN